MIFAGVNINCEDCLGFVSGRIQVWLSAVVPEIGVKTDLQGSGPLDQSFLRAGGF